MLFAGMWLASSYVEVAKHIRILWTFCGSARQGLAQLMIRLPFLLLRVHVIRCKDCDRGHCSARALDLQTYPFMCLTVSRDVLLKALRDDESDSIPFGRSMGARQNESKTV